MMRRRREKMTQEINKTVELPVKIVVSHEKEIRNIILELLKECGYPASLEGTAPAGIQLKESCTEEESKSGVYLPGWEDTSVMPGRFSCCVVDYARPLREKVEAERFLTYSMESDFADLTARGLRETPGGNLAFEIVGVGVIGRVRLCSKPMVSVKTLLASAAGALACGAPFAGILDALNRGVGIGNSLE